MSFDLVEREHEVFFHTYKRLPIVVDHAEGCRIYDKDGNVFLDFLGGIAVNALGHSHPKIIEAAEKQIHRYMHLSNYFYQDAQIEFADLLTKFTGFNRVFFTNSGTESTEGAIKLVRKWGHDKNKSNIIAFSGGFHGRSYGALSLMDKPLYKEGMGPYLPNMQIISYNDISALEQAVNVHTAAILIEFIQGEGGISVVTPEFADKITELKDKFGFLLIADEIQCGTGRTGKFFGFEYFNVVPDIVTMAKGIGGGLPLGAILAREKLLNVWDKGNHGTTYGGNPVACKTGMVVIEELMNGLMQMVNEISIYLNAGLEHIMQKYPKLILEIRGIGLMKGLLLSFDALQLVNKLIEYKIITNAASGTVLRLVPPLIIEKSDVDELIQKLDLALSVF